MTLYTFESSESELSSVKDVLCNDILESAELKLSHPSIKGLQCIGEGDFVGNGAGGADESNGSPLFGAPSSTRTYSAPAAVLTSLAAVMVVFGVYAYRRRSKDDKLVSRDRPHLDDSDINNSNSISFDDLPMAWSASQTKTNTPAFDMRSIIPKGYHPVSAPLSLKYSLFAFIHRVLTLYLLNLFCHFRKQLLKKRRRKNTRSKILILMKYLWISLA